MLPARWQLFGTIGLIHTSKYESSKAETYVTSCRASYQSSLYLPLVYIARALRSCTSEHYSAVRNAEDILCEPTPVRMEDPQVSDCNLAN
jgi:hypothetical protein